ncbi:MAG: histidine phosphatase family protein, partial [Gammaproteobacteria bacterium]|nr:histidine phosphatase family protein [Gammaproteobacteria bacterium]
MAELYLIRHAQASFGAANYDKLSELGHQQSHWLGEHLARHAFDFDTVVLGDMVRHRETLEGLHKGLQSHQNFSVLDDKIQSATVMPQLNEFDFKAVAEGFLKLNPELTP